MESLLSDPLALVLIALALAATFWLGLVLGRRRAADAIERARELEDRLQLAEDEMNRYRQDVSEHFGQTSQLLRDLTLQYRNVYEHLAEGARTLCPEAGTLLPGSLAEAALPAEASQEERQAAAAAVAPGRTNGAGLAATGAAATAGSYELGSEPEPAPEPEIDDGQLDLLENADRWHEDAAADVRVEELEPLLDEELEERSPAAADPPHPSESSESR